MPLAAGSRLGPYEILAPLGAGGMGEVYKARDTRLERMVAVKVLPANKVADPDRKLRFIQEAKAASALNHPNIVTIYDISADNGVDFIVMEFVPGKALDQMIPRKGLRVAETLKYAVQIADGLTAAHASGNRASRFETGEHHGERQRSGESARLRAGEADRKDR
jgi:serine/threonine protein kinase